MAQNKRLICGIITAITILIIQSDAFAGYNSTVRRWTKSGRAFAFQTMDARLIWSATMLTADVLNAQNQLLMDKKMLPSSGGVKEDKRFRGISFFVSLYTHKDLKEFSLDGGSVWKIILTGEDGKEIAPTSIVPVTIMPTEKVFYPYLNRWSKAYMVEFPVTEIEIGKNPELILRSVVAESKLKWKMK